MAFDPVPSDALAGSDPLMTAHRPVMLAESLAGLALGDGDTIAADACYIDCTFGRGGHSRAILDALAGRGMLHAIDQDPEAIRHAETAFADAANFRIHHANFSQLRDVAEAAGISGKVTGILLDLGVSSPQLDTAERGFSFGKDGPLDMRMNPQAGEPAAEWLARASDTEIADVLYQYGEERNSRRIARRIVEARMVQPLTSTAQLAQLIASVPGPRSRSIHPATRSFQAIRIFINRELDVLRDVLAQAMDVLQPGGRLVVISFHSLEDRIVKRTLRDAARAEHPQLKLRGKQFPSDAERASNPRARSAVLRIAEKLAEPGR
jgi:16S rRNA (cytosine1402-N4)-methyltransferase